MKYLKILGLAAVAAMAVMAFVGAATASATVLCKTSLTSGCAAAGQDWPSGTTLSASLEGTSILKSGSTTLNTCTGGKFAAVTTSTGGSAATVTGNIETIDFENCVSPVDTEKEGTLEIHYISGSDNGTVTATGTVIGNTIFGTNCLYQSGTGLDIGVLTGGVHAILDINALVTEAEPKKAICPDTATWEAKFKVTTPTNVWVSAS